MKIWPGSFERYGSVLSILVLAIDVKASSIIFACS